MQDRIDGFTMLIVDDDPDDIELLTEALEETGLPYQAHALQDGDQALALLRREGAFAESPNIDLVLLDLHLPGRGGLDVLHQIKSTPSLCRLPVIVFTGSWAEADIQACYASGANAVVIKPVGFTGLVGTLETLLRFWFQVAALPGPG